VFQNYALFPHMTIFGERGLRPDACAASTSPTPRSTVRVREVLALVRPARHRRAAVQHASCRAASGSAWRWRARIVIEPGVLLFDEPLSNLDARLRVQMRHEIRSLQRRLGITTIYVTHDQEEAMAVSDRIVVMNQGRVVQVGSAEDLYLRPQTGFVARFIGRINTLPARVLALGADGAEVEVLGLRLQVALPAPGVAVGQTAQLMIRPEALRVVAADAPQAWPATVTASTFLGEKVELHLQGAGQPLLVVRPGGPGAALPEGQAVGVQADAASMLLLPPEAP
jgi:iron(III) transport system ATP-binding protein